MTLGLNGRRPKQHANSPGGFWRLLDTAGDTDLCSMAATCANYGDTHVNLFLTKKEELVMDVQTSVSLGCRDHEIARCHLPRGIRKENRRVKPPDLSEADFGPSRGLSLGIP